MKPDEAALLMYRKGYVDGLRSAEAHVRQDRRVSLAKDYGYVPGWQKRLWDTADEIAVFRGTRELEIGRKYNLWIGDAAKLHGGEKAQEKIK